MLVVANINFVILVMLTNAKQKSTSALLNSRLIHQFVAPRTVNQLGFFHQRPGATSRADTWHSQKSRLSSSLVPYNWAYATMYFESIYHLWKMREKIWENIHINGSCPNTVTNNHHCYSVYAGPLVKIICLCMGAVPSTYPVVRRVVSV